ncbi:hypothetical protein GUJ93_ZPchr0006g40659 [Zizania palustris]|uniref:FAS1 domain-containing protein n=1 Tax=Zizania palustris TaxID=103762 RepID=A0A8J5SM27_ZIZPA|nr:hypothetical protein GUJ93_ZPchr0006g40659 [Zizania palustris]
MMPLAGVVDACSVLLMLVLVALSAFPACRANNNITAILAEHRDLAEFSRQLTVTGLVDNINGRNTITVLAVDDAHMAPLKARGLPRDSLRNVLSLHVLVDYYDDAKLHRLPGGSAVVSTLFQASGDAPGSEGMVKIAERRGGRVTFVPQDVDDAGATVFYVKSVHEAPYNISVLQVSAVISSPASEAPSKTEPTPNATDVMSKRGCGRFAALVAATADASATYEKSIAGGLTVFCPTDKAVQAFMPAFKDLSPDGRLALVLYHGVPRHYSLSALKWNNGGMNTLAMDGANGYSLIVRDVGDTVTLLSAAPKPATVTGTLTDGDTVSVYVIDAVLQPRELFNGSHAGPYTAPSPDADANQDGDTGPGDRGQKNGAASGGLTSASALLLAAILVVIV